MLSPSTTNLSINISRTWALLQAVNNVGESGDVTDLYFLIGFLVFLVEREYPAIPCRAGCSQCCIESGLPRTTALEWTLIYRYLTEVMPVEIRLRVIEQNETWHRPQLECLLEEQARIQTPQPQRPVPAFQCSQCPFLLDNLCTIYPVRPAICRAYGYFTWRRGPEQESQVFACRMAADTLLDSLQQQGQVVLALPVWNRIQEKLYALNQGQGAIATLPLWLMAHVSEDKTLLPLNLNPNFSNKI